MFSFYNLKSRMMEDSLTKSITFIFSTCVEIMQQVGAVFLQMFGRFSLFETEKLYFLTSTSVLYMHVV